MFVIPTAPAVETRRRPTGGYAELGLSGTGSISTLTDGRSSGTGSQAIGQTTSVHTPYREPDYSGGGGRIDEGSMAGADESASSSLGDYLGCDLSLRDGDEWGYDWNTSGDRRPWEDEDDLRAAAEDVSQGPDVPASEASTQGTSRLDPYSYF